jgi:poly(3-hydroxybutyrate) depolymerase
MYNNGMPIAITAANLQRRYILSVPTNYVNTRPYKLVIAYHARDSNDHTMYNENYYRLAPLSNNTTIFVAPNGQVNGAPCVGTGPNEAGCGWPNTNDQDMQLADAVVQQVEDNFCVDTNRIFATGWSYGASMSEQTACERPLGGTQVAPWGVRAVATYAVARLSNRSATCTATRPVAYFGHHGTCDSLLTYDGTPRCSTMTMEMGGVGIAKSWATLDGCTWALPQKVTSGAHVCTKLAGCTAGYPVEFCSHSGDHTGYPSDGGNSWGPAEVWAFLNQF